jgi:2-keto-4-pentenoate hydratase/2-oxohepta-3-ene-1,7-dioic acid hydratase in catechol pathway
MAIGRNYADHAKESQSAIPERPMLFAKFPTTIIGPSDEVTWDPGLSNKIDFEAELAVIIGKKARRVAEAEALDYVFGYTCANDVTARDLQRGDGQWVRGKSLDTFCPLGPWLVTADEVPDPQNLGIRCLVNGQTMQDSHTSQMIFGVAYLISYLSQAFTLLPGDILLTGTPDGVGAYREPPVFMQDGDVMAVEIDGVGWLANRCRVE